MFKAMVIKEFLLVLRDKHALLALFILPALFILIMSVAMRDQFSAQNISFKVFVKDLDKSTLSQDLLANIQKNENIKLTQDQQEADFLLKIPRRYEKKHDAKISINVNATLKNEQIEIFKSLLFPTVLATRLRAMSDTIEAKSASASRALSSVNTSSDTLFRVQYQANKELPNSTQQSVPAWIVFGMFFIIIPISTIYINEKKQNTLARLHSMNVSVFAMGIAKSVPYFVINQIQVIIMLCVGIYLVPLFATPALEIQGSLLALFTLSGALSICAIGISSLIAVSASSSEQATTIGGILNILLGAIGGVMVPKFIMPESMQTLADFSPMGWGLDGFLELFLRAGDLQSVALNVLLLLLFGLSTLIVSMLLLRSKIQKGF